MNDKPLTLDEVFELTGLSVAALRSRLNRGELSGVKVAKGQRQVWALLPSVVEGLKNESSGSSNEYEQVVKRWIQEQELGFNRPEPLSSTTIARRKYGLLAFWDYLDGVKPCDTNNLEAIERRRVKMSKGKALARITTDNIAVAISSVPVENSATRHNIYDTMLSFYQSLIEQGHRTEAEILKFKKFRPKKNRRPRRTFIKDDETFNELLLANQAWYKGRTAYDRLMTDTLLKALWYTGGRNSEICYLQRRMVDFKERKLMFTGKGDIDRFVGIHPELFDALKVYATKRPGCSHRYFFTQENGEPLNPRLIQDRVKEAAKRIDIDLTPHGLRRSFITKHLVTGSSATLVQKIVGHKQLGTTNLYDMATANDALNLLRNATVRQINISDEDTEDDF